MSLINLIIEGRLSEAKELIYNRLDSMAYESLQEEKSVVASNTYEWVEEELDESYFEDDENELNSVEITSFLSEYYLIYIDKLPNAELF